VGGARHALSGVVLALRWSLCTRAGLGAARAGADEGGPAPPLGWAYFVENLKTVFEWKVSPGFRMVVGKSG
jgi:hypothetical protein